MSSPNDQYSTWSRDQLRRRLEDLKETHESLCARHQKAIDAKAELEQEVERLRSALWQVVDECSPSSTASERAQAAHRTAADALDINRATDHD